MNDHERDMKAVRLALSFIGDARNAKSRALEILEGVRCGGNEIEDAIMLLRSAQMGHAIPLLEWIEGLLAKAVQREDA